VLQFTRPGASFNHDSFCLVKRRTIARIYQFADIAAISLVGTPTISGLSAPIPEQDSVIERPYHDRIVRLIKQSSLFNQFLFNAPALCDISQDYCEKLFTA